jgi:hypothetical protein
MDRLEKEIRRQAKRIGLPAASELLSIWPEAVGETIAVNAWPARLSRKGVLHVNTTSASWAFELGQLAPQILSRLREALGDECPQALRFATGPVPARGREAGAADRIEAPEISDEEHAQAEQMMASIEDRELRDLIARAAAASLARSARK